MPDPVYPRSNDTPLRWLGGTRVRTPSLGRKARRDLGAALRILQQGGRISLPHSRPMPSIGARCHELRVREESASWRLVYRMDPDAILVVDLFRKTTRRNPTQAIERCRKRLRSYDADATEDLR